MRTARMLTAGVVTAAVALASAGIAQADVYTVGGSTTASGGTKAKPKGTDYTFRFNVSGDTPGTVPNAVSRYKMKMEGVVPNTAVQRMLATCSLTRMRQDKSENGCPRAAQVGKGSMRAIVGQPGSPLTEQSNIACTIEFKVWNIGNGRVSMFVRAGSFNGCPAAVNEPIAIRAVKEGNGTAVTFTVPTNLLHVLPGTTTGLTEGNMTFTKKMAQVGGQRRYLFETVGGCATQSKRKVQITFTPETAGPAVTESTTLNRC